MQPGGCPLFSVCESASPTQLLASRLQSAIMSRSSSKIVSVYHDRIDQGLGLGAYDIPSSQRKFSSVKTVVSGNRSEAVQLDWGASSLALPWVHETTRFRPLVFASYKAMSARSITELMLQCAVSGAIPKLAVVFRWAPEPSN